MTLTEFPLFLVLMKWKWNMFLVVFINVLKRSFMIYFSVILLVVFRSSKDTFLYILI